LSGIVARDFNAAIGETRLTIEKQPLREREQASGGKEYSKDRLVMTRQPVWEVDVEVIFGFWRETGGKIAERAVATIQSQDQALKQNQRGGYSRKLKPVQAGGNRNGHDAGDEEQPDRSVQKFDGDNDGPRLSVGLHEKDHSRTWAGAGCIGPAQARE